MPLEAVDKPTATFDTACTVSGTEEWTAQMARVAPTKAMDSIGGSLWDPEVSFSGGDGGGVIEGSTYDIISGPVRPARSQQLGGVAASCQMCFYVPSNAL